MMRVHMRNRFLAAWKQGVWLAGEEFFYVKVPVESATDKKQLMPNSQYINEKIGMLSDGQAAFLAAMCSFYSSHWGQKLLEKCHYPNICDLAAKLEDEPREIIAELFFNYDGW